MTKRDDGSQREAPGCNWIVRCLAINAVLIAAVFGGWIGADWLYVRAFSDELTARTLVEIYLLVGAPLLLLIVNLAVVRAVPPEWRVGVVIGAVVLDVIAVVGLILTVGIGFHFSIGGSL